MKKCKRCQKIFKSTSKIKIFCSANCRLKFWVETHRDYLNQKVREYRARRYKTEGCWYDKSPKAVALKQWMIELKSEPCTDCNTRFPICCMDFDHRIGTIKEFNIGSMFAHHYSRELIEKELAKCNLVCSNCHRIRTQKRKLGSGKNK